MSLPMTNVDALLRIISFKLEGGRAVRTSAPSTDSVVKEDADVNKVVPLVQDEDNNCPSKIVGPSSEEWFAIRLFCFCKM